MATRHVNFLKFENIITKMMNDKISEVSQKQKQNKNKVKRIKREKDGLDYI